MGEVLRAYDWFESGQIREWWGDDPPWWLVLGVRHYHRVLHRVLAESYRLDREKPKPPGGGARLPPGHEMEFEIKG